MEENIKINLEIGLQLTSNAKYIPVLHCGENGELSYSYYAENEEELIELITDYIKDALREHNFDLYLDNEED